MIAVCRSFVICEDKTIAKTGFTESERTRFRNLLEVAAQSPYQGERDNALRAAERLAKKRGMSLEDAAGVGGSAPPLHHKRPQPRRRKSVTVAERSFATALHLMDFHLQQAKAKRDAALKAAYHRGLDKNDAPRRLHSPRRQHQRRQSRRLPAEQHACALLRETEFSLREIARITGLDIYRITSLKLQMRNHLHP